MVLDELTRLHIEVRQDEMMKGHTTFKTGGPAGLFILPDSVEQMTQTVGILKKNGCPYRILGKGSNLLVDDAGVPGAVICTDKLLGFLAEGDTISAMAGENITAVSRKAAELGLSGLEFACGIPGSVGGAIVMNAGAYGGEMKDVVTEVTAINRLGEVVIIKAEDMDFGYRHSCVDERELIVLLAVMKLKKDVPEQIALRNKENLSARSEKQPLEYPSAGSTFKRPEGYFAGKLIDDAGLRGFSVGQAQVSEKHCGFIINRGNATSEDIKKLIELVSQKVYDDFKVKLECELRIWP